MRKQLLLLQKTHMLCEIQGSDFQRIFLFKQFFLLLNAHNLNLKLNSNY